MILTITTTHQPATDLGYLLHKNPRNHRREKLAFGDAHVFFPEASDDRCTAALMLEVDPIRLVRGPRGMRTLEHYVNDRPYAANSFLSTAIARLFGTALSGRSKERQDLADTEIDFEVQLPALPCRGGEGVLRELFEPLGYTVTATTHALDEKFLDWGNSRTLSVTLTTRQTLQNLLRHLYVLVPVLDDEKHYWVGRDEVEKLLHKGDEWLADHPAKEMIVSRYLKRRGHLTRDALARLVDDADVDAEEADAQRDEDQKEKPLRLNDQRMEAVLRVLTDLRVTSVVDLGCGEGRLLKDLVKQPQFTKVIGVDVSCHALERAAKRLKFDWMGDHQRERIELRQGSMVYRDDAIKNMDAIAAVEVIEHMDPWRLPAFEDAVFAHANPRVAVVTTPNVEFNVTFENLAHGKLRNRDHRFEWTRQEFHDWADRVAEAHGYAVRYEGIGEVIEPHGAPTQMAIFTRKEASHED